MFKRKYWINVGGQLIMVVILLLLGLSLKRNGIYPLSTSVLMLGASTLVVVLSLLCRYREDFKVVPRWALFTLGGFLSFSWLSFVFSETATRGFAEMVLGTAAVILMLTLPFWWRKLNKRWFLWGVLLLGVINSAWAIGQYFYRLETRVAGLFYNPSVIAEYYPNAFALSCLLLLPIGFYFLSLKSWTWRIWGGLSTVIIGSSLVLSWSRGGWLGGIGILGLVIALLVVQKKWQVLKQVAVVLVAIAVLLGGAQAIRSDQELPINNFVNKAQFAGTEAQTSVGERKDFMRRGLKLSLYKPSLGYGPDSFPLVYPQMQEIWLANAPHPHNWFIKIALERGWFAASFFIAFWLIFVLIYLRNWKNFSDASHFAMIAIAAAMGHNLIDFNFNFVFNIVVLALLVSLVLSEQTVLAKRPKQTRFLISLLIGLFILFASEVPIIYQLNQAGSLEELTQIEPRLYIGEKYLHEAYLAEQEQNWDVAISALNKHLVANPRDAAVWNRLGDYYWRLNQPVEALDSYSKALALDAKNSWSYYFNKLSALQKLNRINEINLMLPEVVEELTQYSKLAAQNVHFTAQSPNLKNALLTVDLLLRTTNQQDVVLQEIKRELLAAADRFRTK